MDKRKKLLMEVSSIKLNISLPVLLIIPIELNIFIHKLVN